MAHAKPFGSLFISAGASKCGTTWLYSVLAWHPELHFTPEKETHYFHYKYSDKAILSDERRLANAKTRVIGRIDPAKSNIAQIRRNLRFMDTYLGSPIDDAWYASLFRGKRPGAYSCDFSNFYALLSAGNWMDIANSCEKLKVLYTMRDPLDRLWSHIRFHLQMSGQTEASQTWGPDEFAAFAKRPFIWNNCEYGSALRKMATGLPGDALHVQFYEDMLAAPRAALAKLEGFLGIAAHDYPSERLNKKVNVSHSRQMPSYLRDIFGADLKRIATEVEDLGHTLPASWRTWP